MTEAMEVDQAVPPTTTANDNQNGDDNGAIAAPITEEGHEKKAETNGSGEKVVEIIMGEPEISAEAGESSSKPTVEEPNILKTSAPMDEKDYSKNVKYDPSVLPESDDAYEIRKQVDFYFGDSNLPGDKHLFEKTGGEANNPVSLKSITTFRRMKRFQPYDAVVAALKESSLVDVVGEDGEEMIKRKVPWKPTEQMKIDVRSIYVKGFGDEEPSSQFDIEAFFTPYGPLNSVRLRRTWERYFKGSVYVEFSDEETYQKFIALEPKPLWKGKHELMIKPKVVYLEGKNEGIRDGSVELNDGGRGRKYRGHYGGRGRGGRGHGRGRGGRYDRDRGDRDPDNWKQRREHDQANGFKDHRDGRGKRGKGRRQNDWNLERQEKHGSPSAETEANQAAEVKQAAAKQSQTKEDEAKPESMIDSGVQTSGLMQDASTSPAQSEKKRPREDDGGEEEQPAKKVDVKVDTADSS